MNTLTDIESKILQAACRVAEAHGLLVDRSTNGNISIRCPYFNCIEHAGYEIVSSTPPDAILKIFWVMDYEAREYVWVFSLYNQVFLMNEPVDVTENDDDRYLIAVDTCPTSVLIDKYATKENSAKVKVQNLENEYCFNLTALDVDKFDAFIDPFLDQLKEVERKYYVDQIKRAEQVLLWETCHVKVDKL